MRQHLFLSNAGYSRGIDSERSQRGSFRRPRFLGIRHALTLAICLATATTSPAQTFTSLFSFDNTDGAFPYAGLVQATDGNYYGTTYQGAYGYGTVFKINAAGKVTTVYSFCQQSGCADGSTPIAGLIQATNGNFWGTTNQGGAHMFGTVFKITAAGKLTTVYSFCSQNSCMDGAYPNGLVQGTDGNFYGTTADPGTISTVFKLTPAGKLTTLHTFPGPDVPVAALTQAAYGDFYGTTIGDLIYGFGTVFKITAAGNFTTLYTFGGGSDGANPNGLIQATDGNFYGTTNLGGANCSGNGGCGTVFRMTSSGKLTTLYSFCSQSNCADGADPDATLVQATDGNFYGTTLGRDSIQYGTVFKITAAGKLTTLYSCSQSNCTDGANPYAGPIQATDGNFYGTTLAGGTYSYYGTGVPVL
jgi:uncharacterized repeat protein (TIGR03803 family)